MCHVKTSSTNPNCNTRVFGCSLHTTYNQSQFNLLALLRTGENSLRSITKTGHATFVLWSRLARFVGNIAAVTLRTIFNSSGCVAGGGTTVNTFLDGHLRSLNWCSRTIWQDTIAGRVPMVD